MSKDKTIAIIICYMGKLPWYFTYFTHTCSHNQSIDFFIISDDKTYKYPLPTNVHLVFKTLEEINDLATNKLGFNTKILSAYKLCDFKPTYGLLFSELIEKYDFWGHGDIDIIYGNIRKFITSDVLNAHDIIAIRHDFLTGYFLLFKNNDKMKFLFTHSKDYIKVLASDQHFCFDETNFCFTQFEMDTHYSNIKSEVESMTHVVKRLNEEKYIRAYFDFHVIEGAYGKLSWTNGTLMYKNKYEVILYHLIAFKLIYKPEKIFYPVPLSFNISPTRIYKKY